jgi:hypothetical protein
VIPRDPDVLDLDLGLIESGISQAYHGCPGFASVARSPQVFASLTVQGFSSELVGWGEVVSEADGQEDQDA